MKKILFFALISLAVVACDINEHTQYSVTSLSDFEYSMSNFDADSLFTTSSFYGGMSSYSIVFNNKHNDDGVLTGGMVATMKRDSSIVLKSDNKYPQYTMYATSAAWDSEACAVYYQNDELGTMPDHDITFVDNNYGTCSPSYFLINNTQQTVYDVLSEESPSKFNPGDYLKLTITGRLVNDSGVESETGTEEFYLVDWRGCNDEPDSLLTSWTAVVLSDLGNITYIDFDIETNKESLVKTFCFDNLVAGVNVEY